MSGAGNCTNPCGRGRRSCPWKKQISAISSPARLDERPDLITVDVSFISLKLVLPAALGLAKTPAQLVALIKPQFEAGRGAVKKGIVRDDAVRAAVCDDISAFVASLGWRVLEVIPSPIDGGDGNAEFLLGAARD